MKVLQDLECEKSSWVIHRSRKQVFYHKLIHLRGVVRAVAKQDSYLMESVRVSYETFGSVVIVSCNVWALATFVQKMDAETQGCQCTFLEEGSIVFFDVMQWETFMCGDHALLAMNGTRCTINAPVTTNKTRVARAKSVDERRMVRFQNRVLDCIKKRLEWLDEMLLTLINLSSAPRIMSRT